MRWKHLSLERTKHNKIVSEPAFSILSIIWAQLSNRECQPDGIWDCDGEGNGMRVESVWQGTKLISKIWVRALSPRLNYALSICSRNYDWKKWTGNEIETHGLCLVYRADETYPDWWDGELYNWYNLMSARSGRISEWRNVREKLAKEPENTRSQLCNKLSAFC